MFTVYIRPQRYTRELVDQSDYFTVTFFNGYKKQNQHYDARIKNSSGIFVKNDELVKYNSIALQVYHKYHK